MLVMKLHMILAKSRTIPEVVRRKAFEQVETGNWIQAAFSPKH